MEVESLRLLPLPSAYTGEGLRDIAGGTYIGSNAKAHRDLGFALRSLEQGLPDALRWEAARLGMRPKW